MHIHRSLPSAPASWSEWILSTNLTESECSHRPGWKSAPRSHEFTSGKLEVTKPRAEVGAACPHLCAGWSGCCQVESLPRPAAACSSRSRRRQTPAAERGRSSTPRDVRGLWCRRRGGAGGCRGRRSVRRRGFGGTGGGERESWTRSRRCCRIQNLRRGIKNNQLMTKPLASC